MEEYYLESVDKKYFSVLILLLVISLSCFSQDYDAKYWRRISKKEFRAIKEKESQYIPNEFNKQNVIVEKLSVDELLNLERKAFYSSFYRNGIDTINMNADPLQWAKKKPEYWSKYLDMHQEVSDNPEKGISKNLNKYFTSFKVLKPIEYDKYDISKYRFVLRLSFYTDRKSQENMGWILTKLYYVYDRKTGKSYDVFMPMNYTLFDLMKD